VRRIAIVVLAATLAGCGAAETAKNLGQPKATPASETRLGKAADGCSALRWLQDGGQSISFDTQGKEELDADGPYATVDQVACVTVALKTPEFVITHIDETSSNDGPQTDSWDDYTARWKYHPDDGVSLTIIDTQFKAPQ
jgi:hypothetical protein